MRRAVGRRRRVGHETTAAALEPTIRQRLATPVGGMPVVSNRQPTPPPGGRQLTPPPGSPTPPPGSTPINDLMQIPGLQMTPLAAPSGASLHKETTAKPRSNIWIIASTAVVAIAVTLAIVFAMT